MSGRSGTGGRTGHTEMRPVEQTAERDARTASAMSVRVDESSVGRRCDESESTMIRLTCDASTSVCGE